MGFNKLYCQLIAEAINDEMKRAGNIRSWKSMIFIMLTAINGVNLFTLLLWSNVLLSKLFGLSYPIFLKLDIFPGTMLDAGLSGSLTLFTPFLILNYFVIFYKKRYIKILEEYEYKNGRWYVTYVLISVSLAFFPILIAVIVF